MIARGGLICPTQNLNEPYDDEHIPDEYKFVEFEITMFWDYRKDEAQD
jgi:hypothetical protein